VRIILETSEILVILGRHFNTELDPAKVTIRTDPHLEIEITGVTMNGGPSKAPVKGSGEDAFTPPAGDVPRDDSSIEEVLKESEELQRSERNTLKVLPSNIEDEVS
jgi:hypothetical protein